MRHDSSSSVLKLEDYLINQWFSIIKHGSYLTYQYKSDSSSKLSCSIVAINCNILFYFADFVAMIWITLSHSENVLLYAHCTVSCCESINLKTATFNNLIHCHDYCYDEIEISDYYDNDNLHQLIAIMNWNSQSLRSNLTIGVYFNCLINRW